MIHNASILYDPVIPKVVFLATVDNRKMGDKMLYFLQQNCKDTEMLQLAYNLIGHTETHRMSQSVSLK